MLKSEEDRTCEKILKLRKRKIEKLQENRINMKETNMVMTWVE